MNNNYSIAIFDIAKESNTLDQALTSFNQFYEIAFKTKEIKDFLSSPLVDSEEKKKLIDNNFSFYDDFKYFLDVLIDNNQIPNFDDIFLSFKKMHHDYFMIKEVIVKTNQKLDKDELLHLKNILDKKFPKYQIELVEVIEKDESNGVKLYVDSKLISTSVNDNIDELRKII